MLGQRHGTFVVVARVDSPSKAARWLSRCEVCGDERVSDGRTIRRSMARGTTTCLTCNPGHATHGHARNGRRSRELRIWSGMMDRCYRPGNRSYQHYGGRGIFVVARWHEFRSFLADMGEARPGLSLERVDNDGPYGPDNCRWATHAEQVRNTRRNIFVQIGERRMCLAEWAGQLGVGYHKLHGMAKKWGADRAVRTLLAGARSP